MHVPNLVMLTVNSVHLRKLAASSFFACCDSLASAICIFKMHSHLKIACMLCSSIGAIYRDSGNLMAILSTMYPFLEMSILLPMLPCSTSICITRGEPYSTFICTGPHRLENTKHPHGGPPYKFMIWSSPCDKDTL